MDAIDEKAWEEIEEKAWEVFLKYMEELAKDLGVEPEIEAIQKKVQELYKTDLFKTCKIQNEAAKRAWNWAKTIGLEIGSDVWWVFIEMQYHYGF